eukprot:NODE_607_length_6164_cov_0.344930.p4 type:complete len:135 gc:universal NODE_607_length_6164_cov_0.344930:2825-2421(-)
MASPVILSIFSIKCAISACLLSYCSTSRCIPSESIAFSLSCVCFDCAINESLLSVWYSLSIIICITSADASLNADCFSLFNLSTSAFIVASRLLMLFKTPSSLAIEFDSSSYLCLNSCNSLNANCCLTNATAQL